MSLCDQILCQPGSADSEKKSLLSNRLRNLYRFHNFSSLCTVSCPDVVSSPSHKEINPRQSLPSLLLHPTINPIKVEPRLLSGGGYFILKGAGVCSENASFRCTRGGGDVGVGVILHRLSRSHHGILRLLLPSPYRLTRRPARHPRSSSHRRLPAPAHVPPFPSGSGRDELNVSEVQAQSIAAPWRMGLNTPGCWRSAGTRHWGGGSGSKWEGGARH